jgi:hypothetical protein
MGELSSRTRPLAPFFKQDLLQQNRLWALKWGNPVSGRKQLDTSGDAFQRRNQLREEGQQKPVLAREKADLLRVKGHDQLPRYLNALVHHFMILDALRAESANQISGLDVPYVDRREGGDDERKDTAA